MPSPTQHFGAFAEAEAERALVTAGYRIVERNWRGGGSEIDRIAWHGDVLVFVEIRARRTDEHGSPAETVRGTKQSHLVRGAATYVMPVHPMPVIRFDVVSVVVEVGGAAQVEVIAGAFDADPTGRRRDVPLL